MVKSLKVNLHKQFITYLFILYLLYIFKLKWLYGLDSFLN